MEICGKGYREWIKFAGEFGVDERVGENFAISTLNMNNTLKIPRWVKYIYTHDDLSFLGRDFGLEKKHGSIAIGIKAYAHAKMYRLPYFEDVEYLRHITHRVIKYDISSSGGYYNDFDLRIGVDRTSWVLREKDGISRTLAQMSEKPELVWSNFSDERLKHKPKRWQRDFLAGRLKAKASPISGWGMDVVGYHANRLLNGAISYYLSLSHPDYKMWNTLLVLINRSIPELLARERVRVVE